MVMTWQDALRSTIKDSYGSGRPKVKPKRSLKLIYGWAEVLTPCKSIFIALEGEKRGLEGCRITCLPSHFENRILFMVF